MFYILIQMKLSDNLMRLRRNDWVLPIPVSFPCSLRAAAANDGNTPAAEYHSYTQTAQNNFTGKLFKLND